MNNDNKPQVREIFVAIQDKEINKALMCRADSFLSLLNNRGYINYEVKGCPSRNEINEFIGVLRSTYEKM